MSEKVKLQVHHVRFFEQQPQTINCISLDKASSRVAVSRSDASVEIYNTDDNWYQEMVFPSVVDASVESLLWAQGRLFAAGLGGSVVELDLHTLSYKNAVSSNAGPIWCLAANGTEDQIAAGTEDGCVVLFDLSEELQFLRGFGKQDGRILCITWYSSENGEAAIVTGGVNNLRQWSIKSGQPLSRMTLGRQFNKDTIVWCVAVTKDFTIISGDSRGVVTFWNGKESTQLKTFHCHKADVLSMCLSEDGEKVFTGGVDAALFQFALCQVAPGSERRRWVQQALHRRHSHDVRALAHRRGCLISGGVDTSLLVAELKGQTPVREVAPFPPRGLVNIAEESNLIQLQYPTYIEVWLLGAAATPFAECRGLLPLTHKPVRLLQLKAREDQQILCSALCPRGTLAFSDTKGVRLYKINLNKDDFSAPRVTLTRLKAKLAGPAHQMTFTPDSSTLVVLPLSSGRGYGREGRASRVLHLVDLQSGQIRRSLHSVSDSPIQRVCVSPDSAHLALATLDHGVHVFSLQSCQHVCSCPSQKSQVSALAFSPHSPALVIAYCNHKVYEFDINQKEFTAWSRAHSEQFPTNWLKAHITIDRVSFHPAWPDHIVLNTNKALCVLDKTKAPSGETRDKSPSRKSSHRLEGVHTCLKYRYLLYAGFLSNGMLVAVERPPPAIAEALPPSFKVKRFGTS